jgi:hypothetical protein
MENNTIKPGRHVIIIDNSGNRRIMRVKPGTKQLHFKCTIDCDELIGKEYNTFWQVIDSRAGTIQQITDQKSLVKDFFLKDDPVDDNSAESEGDQEDQGPNKAQKTEDQSEVPAIIPADRFQVKGDNRNITDNSAQQKLDEKLINELKDSGA